MSLVDRFDAANLELELADEPLRNVENADIFQMDVVVQGRRKGSSGREVFRIWPGRSDNRLEVVGFDKDQEQLVLMVHEPSRTIVRRERLRPHRSKMTPEIFKSRFPRATLISLDEKAVVFSQRTPDNKRHYLCGRDERQLFIAELQRGVSTVREAHSVLAPEHLPERKDARIVRQGEWFFVEATSDEVELIRENLFLLEHKVPVGPGGGRPHVVDEAVTISRGGARFVRGAVRHPDHRSIWLANWHSVHLNQEVRTSSWALENRVLWID